MAYTGRDFTKDYKGQGQIAVQKLLMEKEGYVKGAFYRDDLGEIDIVWGNEKYGIFHIISRRKKQMGEVKALRFLSFLEVNLRDGVLMEERNRYVIKTKFAEIILDKVEGEENQFVLTAYMSRDKKVGDHRFGKTLSGLKPKLLQSRLADCSLCGSPFLLKTKSIDQTL